MAGVLTKASEVLCGPKSQHGGTVSVSSAAKLRVDESPVLIESSISGKSVADCQIVASSDSSGTPLDKPCSKVRAVTAGWATKLTADGKKVMLDSLQGNTDGLVSKTPQAALKGTAKQTKLTAV